MQSKNVCNFMERENHAISGETAHIPIVLERYVYEDDVDVLRNRAVQVLIQLLVRVLPVIPFCIVTEVIRFGTVGD